MDLVIKRSQWLRGEGGDDSYLLRQEDGKMCCLGFLGLALGITSAELLGEQNPRDASDDLNRWPEAICKNGLDTPLACSLMLVNDNTSISEKCRERTITAAMKEAGINVTFED